MVSSDASNRSVESGLPWVNDSFLLTVGKIKEHHHAGLGETIVIRQE